ncbi:hypothetical protein CMO94_04325 [Candidatus Woesearchaeota archaeon]|jgi:hypothetical protein|nr:hypothetical protein [Candidatus Woesearchaeota archaeon]
MANKIIFPLLIFSLLIISACAETTTAPVKAPQESAKVDVVGETIKIKVIEVDEEIEEPVEKIIEELSDEEGISSEIKELLAIADKQVESLRYSYKGPETNNFFYDFSVKGNKIKYILSPTYFIDVEVDEYDAIYLDKEFETALAYCDSKKCYREGKKAVLDYDESYILTALDWLNEIKNAEKLGEEVIGKKNTWKLAADGFTVWIDTYLGVPVQVEFGDNIYLFEKMTYNDVKDEEVSVKG